MPPRVSCLIPAITHPLVQPVWSQRMYKGKVQGQEVLSGQRRQLPAGNGMVCEA